MEVTPKEEEELRWVEVDCWGRMAAAGLREEWYKVAIAYSLQWILGA